MAMSGVRSKQGRSASTQSLSLDYPPKKGQPLAKNFIIIF